MGTCRGVPVIYARVLHTPFPSAGRSTVATSQSDKMRTHTDTLLWFFLQATDPGLYPTSDPRNSPTSSGLGELPIAVWPSLVQALQREKILLLRASEAGLVVLHAAAQVASRVVAPGALDLSAAAAHAGTVPPPSVFPALLLSDCGLLLCRPPFPPPFRLPRRARCRRRRRHACTSGGCHSAGRCSSAGCRRRG